MRVGAPLVLLVAATACGKNTSERLSETGRDAGPNPADAQADAAAYYEFRESAPPQPSAFKYKPAAESNMTVGVGTVELSPRVLVALLGAPYVADGTKVSGEYTFKGKYVFKVYEWQSTRNSSEGCGPMPSVFWMTDRPYEFHVGASLTATKEEVTHFVLWLRSQASTMLRHQHERNVVALERLVIRLQGGSLSPAKVAAAARRLRHSWKLGPVPATKVTQPLTSTNRVLDSFENWNTGGGRACDPFVKKYDASYEGAPQPAFSFGREDPRSIWQEVLRALVEDHITPEVVILLEKFLAARPGEESNAWENYAPTY